MIYPINHPYYVLSDEMLKQHRRELTHLFERRHPSLTKLTR